MQEVTALNSSIDELNAQIEKSNKEYSEKIELSEKLVEKYKRIASNASNRYIESQAVRLGISSNEIKNKLPDKYTFDDIDSVCESLQTYKLSMNRLPFRTTANSKKLTEDFSLGVTSQNNNSIVPKPEYNEADEVDDMLRSLAGI